MLKPEARKEGEIWEQKREETTVIKKKEAIEGLNYRAGGSSITFPGKRRQVNQRPHRASRISGR